jgi:hypothetical protein
MPAAELRRVLVALLRIAGESVGSGQLLLQVDSERATETSDSIVRIVIGHHGLKQAIATQAADEVREVVNARGGSVDTRTTAGGAAAVVVSLPGVC